MEIEKKLIKKSSLEELVLKLNNDQKQVFAPVLKDDIVNFAKISDYKQMTQDYIVTVQSAKFILFPKVETLFEIETSKQNIDLKNFDENAIPETVLLGTRPCDAAGLSILNSMFGGEINDTIYEARLKKTTIISISCNKCDLYCFCTSVNESPGGTKGSDILLTETDQDKFFVEIITEKGKEILAKYPDLFEPSADLDKNKYICEVPVAFDVNKVSSDISNNFENDIWVEHSLRCISCATCAYVCPTCACFDIQDVFSGNCGKRKRSWDSCGFDLFTLHASGHNPRSVQSQRWRQRIMHKFAYMPDHINSLGCVGCGRCSRACSVDMNLKEHLTNLSKEL